MSAQSPIDGSKTAVLRVAWPIGVSMVSYTLKGFVDMLMVGHLGMEALAGVGLAGILAWNLTAFPWGALRGQRPLVSQYLGAGDRAAALSFGIHAFYFALGASAFFFMFAGQLGDLARRLGESSNISLDSAIMAGEYLMLRMLWSAPMLLAMAVAEYLRSTERPRIPMAADLLAHPLNVAFNYVLIFGKFGAPAMGVRGAAIGTGRPLRHARYVLAGTPQARSVGGNLGRTPSALSLGSHEAGLRNRLDGWLSIHPRRRLLCAHHLFRQLSRDGLSRDSPSRNPVGAYVHSAGRSHCRWRVGINWEIRWRASLGRSPQNRTQRPRTCFALYVLDGRNIRGLG